MSPAHLTRFRQPPARHGAGSIAAETITPRVYPNPSSSHQLPRVRLDLATPARVTVDVLNLRGETITTHDAGTIAAGEHELELAAEIPAALPPGTYFARLVIGGRLHAVPFVMLP